MIQAQLKLRPNQALELTLDSWLWMLTGVWNWSVRKIENDAQGDIDFTPKVFQNILAEHGKKMGVPSHTVQGMLDQAHTAWVRCFKKMGGKPKLKGQMNKLKSIPFPDPIRAPEGNYIKLPGLGKIRFHKQELPARKIKYRDVSAAINTLTAAAGMTVEMEVRYAAYLSSPESHGFSREEVQQNER